MKTTQEKQAAYQADRRTEFRVLGFNYVPKNRKLTAQDSLKMKNIKIMGQGATLSDSTDDDQTPAPPQNNAPQQNTPPNNTPPSNNTQRG